MNLRQLFICVTLQGCIFLCGSILPVVCSAVEDGEPTARAELLEHLLGEAHDLDRSMNYQAALERYEQALAIQKELQDLSGEASTHSRMGAAYRKWGQSTHALEHYRQALEEYRELESQEGQARTLNNIGVIYRSLGEPTEAINAFTEALNIRKQLGDKPGMANVYTNLGVVQFEQGRYALAVDDYVQAIGILQGMKGADSVVLGKVLNNLGLTYSELGQYSQALANYLKAQALLEGGDDSRALGSTMHNIGFLYFEEEEYQQALEYYQRALKLREEINDTAGMASTLNNMGFLLNQQGEADKALELLERALILSRELQTQSVEARALDSIGEVYIRRNRYPEAFATFQEALILRRRLGDRRGERITLGNLGKVLENQGRDALAIVFYKQAVNVSEAMRKEMSDLSREQRESYAEKVSDIYRSLADLLLKQDRVIEAQRVLDLLKVQELEDYLHDVRGNENTRMGLEQLPDERQLVGKYAELVSRVIRNGRELRALEMREDLNDQLRERLAALQAEQTSALEAYNRFIESNEVLEIEDRMSRTEQRQRLAPEQLNALRDNLGRLQNAVLLYPLVLDDRLELLLVTPDAPPIHRPVPVTRHELNKTVSEFRLALTDRSRDPKPLARKLYSWLIEPLQDELTEAQAGTLIYAPDRVLRYIPLSALHDGEHWLVEKYRVNQITAASLTDLNIRPAGELRVLAGAFSTGDYEFDVGDQRLHFSGLPFARIEVDGIAKTVPGVNRLFDTAFTRAAIDREKNRYTVIHLATHAAFLTGEPRKSFVLLGDGERISLRDIQNWSLTNVDLVVLSACETGLGGRLGNGEEILGFGYVMQSAGARASIASLWSIDDGGTQLLMNAFYELLQEKHLSKAQALQQAQLKLIRGGSLMQGDERGVSIADKAGNEVRADLDHPYYWAPFILIGNGL